MKVRLFVSTMLYAASKRLGYAQATAELMRQAGELDPDKPHQGIPAALTIARAARLEELQLNVNAGATVIGKARSLAAHEFLASDADVWLSVDDDVAVSQDAIAAAVSQCRAEPCLVVVPCLLRATVAAGGTPTVNLVASKVSIQDRAPSGGKIETIEAGGFGCFAVSREAVESLSDSARDGFVDDLQLFKWQGQEIVAMFRDEIIDGEWVTEDFAFCRRLAALDYRRWAVRVGTSVHAGQVLDLQTLEALLQREPGVTGQRKLG